MKSKKLQKSVKNSINKELESLERIKESLNETLKNQDEVIKNIRNGFEDVAVAFIDLVDSTKFKVVNQNEPEIWISRLKIFSDVVREFIEDCNGKVVKYIGDEVMAVFDRDSKIKDAINFIQRIKDIENTIKDITNTKTEIKIALDYGKVFLLSYEGHKELDPQGTPIDRSARIAKHCKPTTILTSYEFVKQTEFPKHWSELGSINFKGLGNTKVFQYGNKTIDVEETIEIRKNEYDILNNTNEDLTLENNSLKTMNKKLQEQIKELGSKPEGEFAYDSKEDEEEELWDQIQSKISSIREIIKNSGVPDNEYARFLFLYMRDEVEEYNAFNGKVFDRSIEEDIVVLNSDERWELNQSNRRNQKIIKMLEELETLLGEYESNFRDADDEELYDYSLNSAEFWENKIGYNVRFF